MTSSARTEVRIDLRCSPTAQRLGRDPLGTAPSMSAVLLIELPQPWPSSIEDHPLLEPLLGVAKDLDLSIKGLVPFAAATPDSAGRSAGRSESAEQPGEFTRMVLHRRGPGPFTEFQRAETVAPFTALVPALEELWDNTAPSSRVDVLVCAHGRRDRCCGSLGTACAVRATADGLIVQRASHLGGHRFAPTSLLLPQGTAWAWTDEELLAAIVERRIEPEELRGHYRGSIAMTHPAAQLLEAEAFFDVGWSWLDRPRSASVEPAGPDRWTAEVISGEDRWVGVVEQTGTVPQPLCGEPLEAAKKFDGVYQLRVAERPAG